MCLAGTQIRTIACDTRVPCTLHVRAQTTAVMMSSLRYSYEDDSSHSPMNMPVLRARTALLWSLQFVL